MKKPANKIVYIIGIAFLIIIIIRLGTVFYYKVAQSSTEARRGSIDVTVINNSDENVMLMEAFGTEVSAQIASGERYSAKIVINDEENCIIKFLNSDGSIFAHDGNLCIDSNYYGNITITITGTGNEAIYEVDGTIQT